MSFQQTIEENLRSADVGATVSNSLVSTLGVTLADLLPLGHGHVLNLEGIAADYQISVRLFQALQAMADAEHSTVQELFSRLIREVNGVSA